MQLLSRLSIIIPIVILIAGFVIFASEKYDLVTGKSAASVTPTPTPTLAPGPLDALLKTSSGAKLDLKGPLVCGFSDKNSTMSAVIKNSKILYQKTEIASSSSILFNGECIYSWKQKVGTQLCGLGQYVGIINSLSNFGILSVDSIIGMLPKLGIDASTVKSVTATTGIKDLVASCKKQAVDDKLFVVPSNVVFKTMVTPSK